MEPGSIARYSYSSAIVLPFQSYLKVASEPELGMIRQIIFVADDFGLSNQVNEAIICAHRRGVLDGASLMMGQPATLAAVALALDNPSLQIGWHVHLNDSHPMTRAAWPWGRSPFLAGMALGFSPRLRRLARQEIQCQWAAFLETGLSCHFVNGHHHLQMHPFVRDTLVAILPTGFDGWLRWGKPCFFENGLQALSYQVLARLLLSPHRGRLPFRLSTTLWGIDRTFNMDAREVANVLATLGDGLHEFLFHPRQVDGDSDTRCLLALTDCVAAQSRGECRHGHHATPSST